MKQEMTELTDFTAISTLEADVVKKTNRYVYFSDGTHMTYSDFHQLKNDIRNEYARVHNEEFVNSVKTILLTKESIKELNNEIKSLKDKLEDVQETTYELENSIQYEHFRQEQMGLANYQKMYEEEKKRYERLNGRLDFHARELYKDFPNLPILSYFQEEQGIKFIIKESEDEIDFKFFFDPYKLLANYHSALSDIFYVDGYYIKNGGWLKVIGNDVILYGKSGDYGVYEDEIAIKAAQVVFPGKNILSFAGKSWDEINYQSNDKD